MADIKLSKEEIQRLEKISYAMDPEKTDPANNSLDVNNSLVGLIKKHFNAEAIRKAFTSAEVEEEDEASKDIIRCMSDTPPVITPAIAMLRIDDVFVRAARRVVNDDKALASVMPARFTKKDAEVLEKCELKSLAALVRARL